MLRFFADCLLNQHARLPGCLERTRCSISWHISMQRACLPLSRCGLAQVQDEAAGLVVAVLDPQPGERVLDCCAAPGGKALFAAARMQGQVGLS